MFEALRCVRGTKALNFSVFLIPNLAHPLIRWVPEESGSSPHGFYVGTKTLSIPLAHVWATHTPS